MQSQFSYSILIRISSNIRSIFHRHDNNSKNLEFSIISMSGAKHILLPNPINYRPIITTYDVCIEYMLWCVGARMMKLLSSVK